MKKEVLKKFFKGVAEFSEKSVEEFAFWALSNFDLEDLETMKKEITALSKDEAEKQAADHIKNTLKMNGVNLVDQGEKLADIKSKIKSSGETTVDTSLFNDDVELDLSKADDLTLQMEEEFVLNKNTELKENIENQKERPSFLGIENVFDPAISKIHSKDLESLIEKIKSMQGIL